MAISAKNADYYRGSWPSYLKYELYKEWEIQEMEAYKSKINNLLNSSPLENNYISDNLWIMYDSINQMPELAIFIFILKLVGFGYIFLLLCRAGVQLRKVFNIKKECVSAVKFYNKHS